MKTKLNNVWYCFLLLTLCLFFIQWVYFVCINPYLINYRMENNAQMKESQLLYTIHKISNHNKIKYFDIIALSGGDRIFVVEYEKHDANSVKKLLNDLGWSHKENNTNILKKGNFTVIVKNLDENTVKLELAAIDTKWGKFYFSVRNYKV